MISNADIKNTDAFNVMADAALGIFEVGVFSVESVDLESTVNIRRFHAMTHYADMVSEIHPLCLCCDLEWTNYDQEPPVAFGYIIPQIEPPPGMALSGICAQCANLYTGKELLDAMFRLMKRLYPDGRAIEQKIHPTHKPVQ